MSHHVIHIHTQYRENYGDAAAPYWKFKGGSTIVVTGFPGGPADTDAAAAAVERLRGSIEYANPMAEEYILNWDIVAAGTLTSDEADQMEFDGHIGSPSTRMVLLPVLGDA